ncbi:hypothetical protein [Acetivibrio ethanolgignens]|uniref:hypothetical protein n=1 Tax=Acetivibrio ethanolgignens TaxID=290052 RepID=UPI0011C7E9DF|nr:hypothetical protein [Acetivibrio ethanolgignens]
MKYYYRLKCVRQAFLDFMEFNSVFIELPVHEAKAVNENTIISTVAAIMRGANCKTNCILNGNPLY